MTAHAKKEDRKNCLEAGFDDYVSKPIRRKLLGEAIERRLSNTLLQQPEESVPFTSEGKASKKVFDRNEILIRMDNDEELVAMILDSFIKTFPRYIEELHQALKEKDQEAVSRIGHTVKSSSGNAGAALMSETAEQIEKSGHAGDMEKAAKLFENLKNEFDQFKKILSEETS